MNKLISRFGAAAMALVVVACGGKVVVDGGGNNSGGGGAGNLTTSTASGSPHTCGDVVIPSPASLMGCSAAVGSGGGSSSCATDLCDGAGNTYSALCSGNTCACVFNGDTKCGCTTEGVTDFCTQAVPCCPWIPIPL
jgi:hypothetical protein